MITGAHALVRAQAPGTGAPPQTGVAATPNVRQLESFGPRA
jgi:hypothetical protein